MGHQFEDVTMLYHSFGNELVKNRLLKLPIRHNPPSMSENIMAASKSNRLIGCRVTSQASSGVWQIVKKSCFFRSSRNSGRYLPA